MKTPKIPQRNNFVWHPFSMKQKQVLSWWCEGSPYRDYDGVIADGSIRSGKTVSMGVSFVLWAMETFSGQNFALCGKTIGTLRRNVTETLKQQVKSLGYQCEERRSDNLIIVWRGKTVNYFYLFGGNDKSSQDLIQGITLAGILFDEVALMPESFVLQGIGRCSVEGSKFWFSCNPQGPSHWFKKDYIEKAVQKRLFYLHFTMDDNLTLSDRKKEAYRRQFTGVFFQRNILGLWVAAEGKIYIAFGDANIVSRSDWHERNESGAYSHPLRNRISMVTMGVDFGGNKSSHAFVLTGFTRGFQEMITLKELRIMEEVDPVVLNRRFVEFCKECRSEYPGFQMVYCDSAEQVLIRGFRRAAQEAKLPVVIRNAQKGEIIDRIRFYSSMQAQQRHFIVEDCKETIQAFEEAVWDPDKNDVRLDDGTTNIDNLDAQEYSSEFAMKIMMQV